MSSKTSSEYLTTHEKIWKRKYLPCAELYKTSIIWTLKAISYNTSNWVKNGKENIYLLQNYIRLVFILKLVVQCLL